MNYLELTTKLTNIDKKYRGDDYNKWRQEGKNKLILKYNRELVRGKT